MATHFSILAWKIPWTEEPGGLQSMGPQRVTQDLATEQNHIANYTYNFLNTTCLSVKLLQTCLTLQPFGL